MALSQSSAPAAAAVPSAFNIMSDFAFLFITGPRCFSDSVDSVFLKFRAFLAAITFDRQRCNRTK